jgi:hypothetical protein
MKVDVTQCVLVWTGHACGAPCAQACRVSGFEVVAPALAKAFVRLLEVWARFDYV